MTRADELPKVCGVCHIPYAADDTQVFYDVCGLPVCASCVTHLARWAFSQEDDMAQSALRYAATGTWADRRNAVDDWTKAHASQRVPVRKIMGVLTYEIYQVRQLLAQVDWHIASDDYDEEIPYPIVVRLAEYLAEHGDDCLVPVLPVWAAPQNGASPSS